MKKLFITFFMLIALVTIFIIIKNSKSANKKIQDDNVVLANEQSIVNENEEKKITEITIYDIEEGYMNVAYNENAEKHSYNWDKYLNTNNTYYNYNDENYTTKVGIDVSEFQGDIDWKKVKNSGVEFVILKLGYRGYGESGKLVIDSNFEKYYEQAINQGIDVGVYFFSQAINIDEVREEADLVLKNIEGKTITYPVVFDLEKIKYDTARTDNLTMDEITEMMLEFCKIIKENGYTPSIYGNAKTFTTKTKLELFNEYNKWYADYQAHPLYPYEFDMWQYTETGSVDGIEGNADIDICFIKKR